MITYVNATGCHARFFNSHQALLNWFVDVEDGEKRPIVNVASGAAFIPQMLTAVERLDGRTLRIDLSKPEEEQCADILRYICAAGGIKKLRFTGINRPK
jgi:hypothetical protein